mgnify:CR=1 FL=1
MIVLFVLIAKVNISLNMARIIKAIKDICVKNVQKHFLLLLVHCFHTLKSNLINGLNISIFINGDTLARSADIAGISEPTSLVWRHKILSVLADLTHDNPVLSDTVYLDEKLNVVIHPGKHMENKEKQKRGMSSQKRNIVCAIDQHNNKVIQVSETGRIHSKELYKYIKIRFQVHVKL